MRDRGKEDDVDQGTEGRGPVSVGAWNAHRSSRSIKIQRQEIEAALHSLCVSCESHTGSGWDRLAAGWEKGGAFLQAVARNCAGRCDGILQAGERCFRPRLKLSSPRRKRANNWACGLHYGQGSAGVVNKWTEQSAAKGAGSQPTFALYSKGLIKVDMFCFIPCYASLRRSSIREAPRTLSPPSRKIDQRHTTYTLSPGVNGTAVVVKTDRPRKRLKSDCKSSSRAKKPLLQCGLVVLRLGLYFCG